MALRYTQNLAEVAGAATLAAALKVRDRLAGRKVVAVMTGGNLNMARLQQVLAEAAAEKLSFGFAG